jgi:hypothetical protein
LHKFRAILDAMRRGWVLGSVAVLLAYTMLLVLVSPSVPTPIYVGKGSSAGPHAPVAVLVSHAAVVLPDLMRMRDALPRRASFHRNDSLIDLACQRLC